MELALWSLAGLVVFGIAAIAIGRVVGETVTTPRVSVFDLAEATEYVAERLPFEQRATLTYDDVRSILGWHLDYLEARGVAFERDPGATSEPGVEVIDDDRALAWVLGKVAEAGLEVSDADVATVLDEEARYLRAIGAIGGPVPEPELDEGDRPSC